MTKPKRSRVVHGMASCGRYGCTRPECRRAYNKACKANRFDVSRGRRAAVDTGPAADHARLLVAAGMPVQEIAKVSGVSGRTVCNLLAGRCERIYRTTAEAVLAIPVPRGYTPVLEGLVDATPTRRRLQALCVRGFTLDVLAGGLGVTKQTVNSVCQNRRRMVRVSLQQAVAALYSRWWNADPLEHGVSVWGCRYAASCARKKHWAPPAAWDDDRIADPAARPYGIRAADVVQRQLYKEHR